MVLRGRGNIYSNEELLSAIASGGRELDVAVGQILQQEGPKIMNYLRSKYGNKEDAEDILHDGIAVLILNIRKGKFRGDSSLYSYLFSICKQIQYKLIRKDTSKENWEKNTAGEIGEVPGPDIALLTTEMKTFAQKMLSTLGEKCQKVLSMWSMSYSMTEIAQRLNYSSSQVAMNKKNACMKLLTEQVKKEHKRTPFW